MAVEKVRFSENSGNLGDRKCLGKLRKSFVGLPNVKFFRPFSGEGVFQQPQAISLIDRDDECNRDFAPIDSLALLCGFGHHRTSICDPLH